ncbi:rod shape-determining protein MreD [Streptococcus sp. sy010]|uniref:rod shape-determining protein MreD n=1 Tax=Streptococcus sp. sy010 TaxID=2600148 RepID=UPI0011B7D7D6|nr:rod shape-determining protein MreD [Streptococcus sp. sy010]TWT16154.1 rod shape-determining protein MreD [Streptococcus sp. sy010]
MLNNKWMNLIFLLLTLLVDVHLSNSLNQFFNEEFRLVSHIFLFVLVYQARYHQSFALYWLYAIVGFLGDVYYFRMIGLTSLLFPSMLYVLRKFPKFQETNPFQLFLVVLLVNFFFEIALYVLAYTYQLTTYPIVDFIAFSLAPSLLYNSFISLLLLLGLSKRNNW